MGKYQIGKVTKDPGMSFASAVPSHVHHCFLSLVSGIIPECEKECGRVPLPVI